MSDLIATVVADRVGPPSAASVRGRRNRRRARSFLGAVIALLFGIPATGNCSAEFLIHDAALRLKGTQYVLDARVGYDLSSSALEALENGVPLTLEVRFQIQRVRPWLWDQRLVDLRIRHVVHYHALASLYQVVDLDSGEQRNFATRGAALSALGEINSLPIIGRDQLEPGVRYDVSMRASLDIESLPLPLRPLAYLSPSWGLSSEWRRWQFQP